MKEFFFQNKMYNIEEQVQTAVLVAVDLGEYDIYISLDELEELANTAGAQVLGKFVQKRVSFDRATFIGKGRLEEIGDFCSIHDVQMIIFDHELSATQIRNIEEICNTTVIDRTMLILDIFAGRANTSEGRLQVELAQQKYRLPRLAGLGNSLSRLGGGIGTRGPGETKLETDRRHIRTRIETLQQQLEQLAKRRELIRLRRKKESIITVAIVGYTNVGKSSLLNALTDAGVLVEDKLFATLDPTSRALTLPDGRNIMLIDTVGLVRRLPHHLVEAFKSTLEQAAHADLLLNVCDITSPSVYEQIEVTKKLFADLGVQNTPIITVLNKCDLVFDTPLQISDNTAIISAKTGAGFDELLSKIARNLAPTHRCLHLLIPYEHSGLIDQIRADGKILKQEFLPLGTRIEAMVDLKLLHKCEKFIAQ